MKFLIRIVAVLGFIGTVEALELNPIYKNYATPERLERWQGLSENMSYHDLFVLAQEMNYMPERPWPEPYKQILLKMGRKYRQYLIDKHNLPIILPDFVVNDRCGEIYSNIAYMINWQEDPRFVFFYDGYSGGGAMVKGLAGMGPAAFEVIIKKIKAKGYAVVPLMGTRALNLIMEKEDNFILQDPVKYNIAQEALIEATRSDNPSTINGAIKSLRYFPSDRTKSALETISLEKPSSHFDGRARQTAKSSLQYILQNGY